MALINCPECGKQISEVSEKCVHCGFPIRKSENPVEGKIPIMKPTETKPRKPKRLLLTLGIVAVIIVTATAFGVYLYSIRTASKSIPQTDLVKMNLKGKVKSIIEKTYSVTESSNKPQKNKFRDRTVFQFDINGNMIEKSIYNEKNDLNTKFSVQFDQNGKIKETTDYQSYKDFDEYPYPKEGITNKETYEYDGNGKLIKKITSGANVIPNGSSGFGGYLEKYEEIYAYEYDTKGNLIQEISADNTTTEDSMDKYNGKTTYRYDDNGNKTEMAAINLDNGEFRDKATFLYDSKNNLIEECYFNLDGSIRRKQCYKYDEKNNLVEKSDYNSVTKVLNIIETSSYDEKENLTESTKFEYGMKIVSKFDEFNNWVLCERFDANGDFKSKSIWKYENADQSGNWTNKIQLLNGNDPDSMTEREITYY